jgi:hypothetical protein
MFKELNPRRRVYVEIPKPARVELKWLKWMYKHCSHHNFFNKK